MRYSKTLVITARAVVNDLMHFSVVADIRFAHLIPYMYIVAYMHIFATAAQSGNDYSVSVSINILFDMDVDIWHEICS